MFVRISLWPVASSGPASENANRTLGAMLNSLTTLIKAWSKMMQCELPRSVCTFAFCDGHAIL